MGKRRVTPPAPRKAELSNLQAIELQMAALRHAQAAEMVMRNEDQDLSTIACTGAYILGRAAFYCHTHLAKDDPLQLSFRQRAHAMLAEVLDDVELLMTQTEGRA